MRHFSHRRVRTGQNFGWPSRRAYLRDPHPWLRIRSEQDRAILAPASAAIIRRLCQDHGGAPASRDALELSIGEEADPLTVGREELAPRPLGARQRAGLQ